METFDRVWQQIAVMPWMADFRRNHALQHATFNILQERRPGRRLNGQAVRNGFYVVGDTNLEEVTAAAEEGASRLHNGEAALALYPGCTLSNAMNGLLGISVFWLIFTGPRSFLARLLRLPFAVGFGIAAFAAGNHFNPQVQQKFTTDAAIGGLHVTGSRVHTQEPFNAYQIITSFS